MVQRSAFTEEEIIQMIRSDDTEDQGVAARNLWSFWKGWVEDADGSTTEEKEQNVRTRFASVAPLIYELLVRDVEKIKGETEYRMPRHIWHYLISLGCLQYPDAIDSIHTILTDSSIVENVRAFAADSLTRYRSDQIGDEIVKSLWQLALTDDSLPVRVNSIRAIATKYKNSKNPEISKRIWDEIVNDEDIHSAVISTAMAAIGDVGSKTIVPDLIHMMITRRTGALKKDAALALDRIAVLNGLTNREDLIKDMKDIE